MKKILATLAMLAAASTQATIYNDPTSDLGGGATAQIIDLTSVTVSNDATTVYFAISAVANPINVPDWGKYMIGFDTTAGGDTAGNGWGRPISMSTGMDFWIGSWVDGGTGGAQLWNWTGSAWNGPAAATYAIGSGISFAIPLASLGLNVGDSFTFDVYTSGGGASDTAIDALSTGSATVAGWTDPFQTTSPLSYTVVPEPSTMALIAIAGGLLAARRMRRS